VIAFFGSVHSDGGCGTELLGAIELLRAKRCDVRLIVPPDQDPASTPAAEYFRNIGCEIDRYSPGMFKSLPVLVSFAEGWKLFPLIKENNDRPAWVVYSDCMHYASDDEVGWFKENLIDEFIFQTRALADRLGPEISRRSQKAVNGRHGYRAFINPVSEFFPLRFVSKKPEQDFTVLKVGRDHEEKWHQDSCRMFCGINAPFNRPVKIEIVGWGKEGANKIGDLNDENNKWFNEFTTTTHSRIYDFKVLAEIYNKAHALVHVCDYKWEEALGRVFLESFVAGVVVIADRRGGAQQLIRHGQTGFLVDTPDEAAYYASHLAFNEWLRKSIAAQAYAELVTIGHGNIDRCFRWWEELVKKSSNA
jgi:glycosyltransferase involved in cell wall biosynthesis